MRARRNAIVLTVATFLVLGCAETVAPSGSATNAPGTQRVRDASSTPPTTNPTGPGQLMDAEVPMVDASATPNMDAGPPRRNPTQPLLLPRATTRVWPSRTAWLRVMTRRVRRAVVQTAPKKQPTYSMRSTGVGKKMPVTNLVDATIKNAWKSIVQTKFWRVMAHYHRRLLHRWATLIAAASIAALLRALRMTKPA